MTRNDKPGWWAPAPGGSSEDWLQAPGLNDPLPGVNERLAPPETRVEYLHGIEMFAAPAQPPHAMQHFDLTYVLGAHVAKGYRGGVDMLTRTGHTSDFAPDASIFSTQIDPKTAERQLEDIAFEVCSEQPLGVPTEKARELANRGVRRVFCIVVKHGRVLEWDKALDSWRTMLDDAEIDDPCFARPLPIKAILNATVADSAVAKALLARDVSVLREIEKIGIEKGEALGLQKGEALGLQKGEALGLQKGEAEGLREAARRMLAAGESPSRVAEILKLPLQEVLSLLVP